MQKTVRSAHRQPSAHTAPSSVDTYPAMARCQPLALRQPRSRSAARIARSAASGTATSVGVSYSYKFLIYCCTILSAIHKLYRHCVPLLHQQSVEGMSMCACPGAPDRAAAVALSRTRFTPIICGTIRLSPVTWAPSASPSRRMQSNRGVGHGRCRRGGRGGGLRLGRARVRQR
jgi:hypothetical protein